MSVQEAAWELVGGVRVEGNPPWGGRDGMVCVVERGTDGPHDYQDFELPPEMAEARAVAYLKAAAVARGERGLTAALNRVTAALGSPEPQRAAVPDVGRMVQQMRDALHMADDAPWGLLVGTASRLRVELSEARAALSGKTMHDAAAEVVAPLREAIRDRHPAVDEWSPSDVVRVCHGMLSGGGLTRAPMTHTSLASIKRHGVAVGDRLECEHGATPRSRSGFADEALLMRASVVAAGAWVNDARGCEDTPARDGLEWPLTVVEAPDAH